MPLLQGPFPALERLAIRDRYDGWFQPDADAVSILRFPVGADPYGPYPKLTELCIDFQSPLLRALPPLPNLAALHIDGIARDDLFPPVFKVLSQMTGLEELTIDTRPMYFEPTAPSRVIDHAISLPALRKFTLTADRPVDATAFLDGFILPALREVDIKLRQSQARGIGSLLKKIAYLVGPPLSMRIQPIGDFDRRVEGITALGSAATQMYPELNFSPRDLAHFWPGWTSMYRYEVAISWVSQPFNDAQLDCLMQEISELPRQLLAGIRWLVLKNCLASSESFWSDFAGRVHGVRAICVVGFPPSGLFWAMLHNFESKDSDIRLFLSLKALFLNDVNLGAGGWLAPLINPSSRGISHYECDDTRFLELLVCYLDARLAAGYPSLKLEMLACSNYSAAEIQLIRMLVAGLLWDGWGAVTATYGQRWDEHEAITSQFANTLSDCTRK
uniref:Uncharacterized protein n=1 Tax=Mycena chlorophos TaxID=658473 RepID=A0ABQ0LEL7_MYCCL|nr:predicted protein [Mycena chlorophos]